MDRHYRSSMLTVILKADWQTEYLNKDFLRYAALTDVLYNTDSSFDQEDILPFIYELDDKTYLQKARRVVEREMEEGKEALDKMSEVEVDAEDSGIISKVWSVVGCDTVAECAIDIALTGLTAGTGKFIKAGVKGARAIQKARKAKRIIKSAEHLGKTLVKGLKAGNNLSKFIKLVNGTFADAFSGFGKWLAKDWRSVAKKVSTDLVANLATHDTTSAGTVAVRRANKEYIASIVQGALGINKPDATLMNVALVGIISGKDNPLFRNFIKSFVFQSVKYRFTVNMIFENFRNVAELNNREVMKAVFISTIGEVVQDVRSSVPGIDGSEIAKYGVEVARNR